MSLPRSVELSPRGPTGVEAGGLQSVVWAACHLKHRHRVCTEKGGQWKGKLCGSGSLCGRNHPLEPSEISLLAYGSIVDFLLYEGAELLQAPALKNLCCSHGCGCPAQLGIITIIVIITAFC